MNELRGRSCWLAVILLTVGLVSSAPVLAGEGVNLTTSYAGTAVPRAALKAKVDIEILDGSTLRSIQWVQIGGVDAKLTKADTARATVNLAGDARYRGHLTHVLREPPITAAQLPSNVPMPMNAEGEFPGGLQDRFQVVGMSHFALEEAALVTFEVRVRTSSGLYKAHLEIHTALPFKASAGLRDVPLGVPVLLYGKEQASYNWSLRSRPFDSVATLTGPRTQQPTFTPDTAGVYEVRVMDQATREPVTLEIFAGNWRGVIIAQDRDGRPIAEGLCTACHSGGFAADKFTPWAQTGHAEIFTDNLNTSTHYGEGCFECHTVGHNPDVANGGCDDSPDFPDFLASGLLNNPGDNWTTTLNDFPAMSQLANIQCENCHGPQSSIPRDDTLAHGARGPMGEPRTSLSSDVCASCHGEPLRHARFQQWQLSSHANYELAIEESQSGNCSRCHTANGFLAWLPVLLGDVPGDPTASVTVSWTADEAHAQTCVTCHDPHAIGTTTGIDTNATVRVSGDTPDLIAGFRAVGVGRGALCMTCHNSRRGLRNDATFGGLSDPDRAPHGSTQTDLLMGENAFFVNVGVRGSHALISDTCVNCHMEATAPPDLLAYNGGGTNHTFFASQDICASCHEEIDASVITSLVDAVLADVKGLIEGEYLGLLKAQLNLGYKLDLNGDLLVTDASKVKAVDFGEYHGRQSIAVKMMGGITYGPYRIGDIDVIPPAPMAVFSLPDVAGDDLLKAGWNWNLVNNDGSHGIHNPRFALTVLDGARDAVGGLGGPRSVDLLP